MRLVWVYIDLYCSRSSEGGAENPTCVNEGHTYRTWIRVDGESVPSCLREARKNGWKTKPEGKELCPACKRSDEVKR